MQVADTTFGVCLWALCALLFIASPVVQINDSRFSLVASEVLLHRHSFDLSGTLPPSMRLHVPDHLELGNPSEFYQLLRIKNTIVYAYPLGGPILALPFLQTLDLLGFSTMLNAKPSIYKEAKFQKIIAALLMSTLSVLVYMTGRLLLSRWWSTALGWVSRWERPSGVLFQGDYGRKPGPVL